MDGVTDVILPGADGVLDTVVTTGTDDYYTRRVRDCGVPNSFAPVLLLEDEMQQLVEEVVAHEVGHGVSMRHTATCRHIMYVDDATGDSMLRRKPIATDFQDDENAQIRLHR